MANLKKQRRKRTLVQGLTTLVYNCNLVGFLDGTIYRGKLKTMCVPGLNCYSCPGAIGSCPIGALQATLASPLYNVALFALGFLVLVGGLIGRLVCGFFCPFGWVQDLLYKIKSRKLSTRKLKWLTRLKYVILVVFVLYLPAFAVNQFGIGEPAFCKYICPQGIFQGALPLAAANPALASAFGFLFGWKMFLLLTVLVLSVFVARPFCKWICPLGAIYGLFNRFSIYRLSYDEGACVHCGACKKICPMDVDPTENPNDSECIRCGDCVSVCPTCAIHKPCLKRKDPETGPQAETGG